MAFEEVPDFKYLWIYVNESANSHKEINYRIEKTAENKCFFSLNPIAQINIVIKENEN